MAHKVIRISELDELIGEFFFGAPANVATNNAVLSAPSIVSDVTESWLAEGTLIMAQPVVGPASVTRLTFDVLLEATGSFVRAVLPYSETFADGGLVGDIDSGLTGTQPQYIEVDAKRHADGFVELAVYLTDPITGMDHTLIAYSMTGVSASVRANFTVEAGPRHVRAWYQAQPDSDAERVRCRFQRTTPDVAAHSPDIDALTWGVLTRAGRVYRIEVDQDPVEPIGNDLWLLEADVDDPDEGVNLSADTSSAALVQYKAGAHTKRRRSIVLCSLYGDGSAGTVADHLCHRVDPAQTLVLSPVGEVVTVRVGSVLEGVSSPRSDAAVFNVGEDPTGLDGGIGSGRSSMDIGGELALSPGFIRGESTMGYEQQDIVSDTGGKEAYQQVASRQRRSWDVRGGIKPEGLRVIERVLAASGGVRPVWFMPPLTAEPAAVTFPAVSHEIDGVKRATVSLKPMEV